MKKVLIATVIILIICAALLGFAAALVTKLALFDVFFAVAPAQHFLSKANILVLGVDNAFGHRADTIMILHTNPENQTASLISIPRDTLAVLPGRGLDKINHAFAYGGVELTCRSVEQLLEINIPYYVVVDLSGIIKIIDELGGVTLNVEQNMYYVDQAGGLIIDLPAGRQRLNGQQAMGYLRYRRDGGDFSRINRQQQFLQALASEMIKRDNVLHAPQLFLNLLSYFDTNLDSKKTIALSLAVKTAYELDRIKMATMPGYDLMVDGIYYWRPDRSALGKLVAQYIKEQKPVL